MTDWISELQEFEAAAGADGWRILSEGGWPSSRSHPSRPVGTSPGGSPRSTAFVPDSPTSIFGMTA